MKISVKIFALKVLCACLFICWGIVIIYSN